LIQKKSERFLNWKNGGRRDFGFCGFFIWPMLSALFDKRSTDEGAGTPVPGRGLPDGPSGFFCPGDSISFAKSRNGPNAYG
jgi:hypothetical protein